MPLTSRFREQPAQCSSGRPIQSSAAFRKWTAAARPATMALGVKLQKNFSSGLTYLVGYTWSRSIDTASSIRSHDGDTLFPQNSYNIAAERGAFHFPYGASVGDFHSLRIAVRKRASGSWTPGMEFLTSWSVAGSWARSSRFRPGIRLRSPRVRDRSNDRRRFRPAQCHRC